MSLASKATLAGSIVFTTGIVYYVHSKQVEDQVRMRDGVIRDVERQQMKKLQNTKELQDQIELTKILKAQREKWEKAEQAEMKTKNS